MKVIQLLPSQRQGTGGVITNANACKQGEGDGGHFNVRVHIEITLIKYLVYKRLEIITRFFVSFKVPVSLNPVFPNAPFLYPLKT